MTAVTISDRALTSPLPWHSCGNAFANVPSGQQVLGPRLGSLVCQPIRRFGFAGSHSQDERRPLTMRDLSSENPTRIIPTSTPSASAPRSQSIKRFRSAARPADDRQTHSRPSVPHSDSSLAFSLALRSRTFAHLAHSLRIDHMDSASHTDRQDFPSHPYDSIPHVYKTDRQHPQSSSNLLTNA